MSTVLRLGNYCYFCISLLLPLQKRGRERNFNEWDLPGADRVPLASLTVTAVCKHVRDCSDLSPASRLDVYHQPTDKNTSESGLWQLSAVLLARPPAVPARRWCSPLAGGNATLTKTKPAKKKKKGGRRHSCFWKLIIYFTLGKKEKKILRFSFIFLSSYKRL